MVSQMLHQCPRCGEFHDGDYAQCERCLATPRNPEEEDDSYDYASDDFHSEVRRGR